MNYLDLSFTATLQGERGLLPPFLGATLRGALGHILKETTCQVKNTSCAACLLKSACPYVAIFEGLAPEHRTILTKYPNIPQPFVLLTPLESSVDSTCRQITWGIRLLGSAVRYWPYVVHTFQVIGERGLGSKRLTYEIDHITSGSSQQVIWSPEKDHLDSPIIEQTPALESEDIPKNCTLRWQFHTPVKLKHQGPLDGLDLVLSGKRRQQILQYFYQSEEISQEIEEQKKRFIARDEFETKHSTLRPYKFSRFSGRQQRRTELRGLTGELTITGPWGETGSWLKSISLLHLGKSTSFGFGNVSWQLL